MNLYFSFLLVMLASCGFESVVAMEKMPADEIYDGAEQGCEQQDGNFLQYITLEQEDFKSGDFKLEAVKLYEAIKEMKNQGSDEVRAVQKELSDYRQAVSINGTYFNNRILRLHKLARESQKGPKLVSQFEALISSDHTKEACQNVICESERFQNEMDRLLAQELSDSRQAVSINVTYFNNRILRLHKLARESQKGLKLVSQFEALISSEHPKEACQSVICEID